MLRIQTQENKDDSPPPRSLSSHSYSNNHYPSHNDPEYSSYSHRNNIIQQQQSTTTSPTAATNTTPSQNHQQNQNRRQRRISSTFGGPGSIVGGGNGSGSESPSSSSTASSPSHSSCYSYSTTPATPSPTNSRRLSPLLESSTPSSSAPLFFSQSLSSSQQQPWPRPPSAFLQSIGLRYPPLSHNQPTTTTATIISTSSSSSSPMRTTSTEGMTAAASTRVTETTTTEPYYFSLERPMHPLDSLPPPSPPPPSSGMEATSTASTSNRRAHKINTFGIGPIFGPFPASPTTYQNYSQDDAQEEYEEGSVEYDCGSGKGGNGRRRKDEGGTRRSCASGSIQKEEEKESSPYFRLPGGRARSTFGYDDHYPISPISPLALSAVPSPELSAQQPSSLQQPQHHAPHQPPLPLSSSVHPPRIITTALYIPQPSDTLCSSSSATAVSTSSLTSPGIYSHTHFLSSPTSCSSSSSSSVSAFAIDRVSNYNHHPTARGNSREKNLLFPLGLGIRLNDREHEKNAISPPPSSLPRPLYPPPFLDHPAASHASAAALSLPSPPTGTATTIAGDNSNLLQIDHLHYYQQGLLGRRNSSRSHAPLSFDEHHNNTSDHNNESNTTNHGNRFINTEDDLTAATTSATPTTTAPLSRSQSLSRHRRRLSAFAKRIFTKSPSNPSNAGATTSPTNTSATAVSPVDNSSTYDQQLQYYHTTTPPPPLPITTFTPSSPDISKPITKYPFGHSSHDLDPHTHANKDKTRNDHDDDDDEDEDEVVEDIYLYTLTHLHPTSFVPSASTPASSAGVGVGVSAGVAPILPSSSSSLSLARTISNPYTPPPHLQVHTHINRPSRSSSLNRSRDGENSSPHNHYAPPPNSVRPPSGGNDHSPDRDNDNDNDNDITNKNFSATAAKNSPRATSIKKNNMCASLAIFRFFLKK